MKLSELRPCDSCHGPLTGKGPIRHSTWYVVRVTQAMVSPKANQVAGLAQYFNGHLGLAEVFAPEADDAILVMGDKEPQLMTELFICIDCGMEPPHGISMVMESRNNAKAAEEEKRKTP